MVEMMPPETTEYLCIQTEDDGTYEGITELVVRSVETWSCQGRLEISGSPEEEQTYKEEGLNAVLGRAAKAQASCSTGLATHAEGRVRGHQVTKVHAPQQGWHDMLLLQASDPPMESAPGAGC